MALYYTLYIIHIILLYLYIINTYKASSVLIYYIIRSCIISINLFYNFHRNKMNICLINIKTI